MRTAAFRAFCLAITVMLSLAPAHGAADVLFSTFGPGDTYDTTSGWAIGDTLVWSQGLQFTPSVSGRVHTIEIAAFRLAGGAFLNASLFTDNADQPGSLLELVQVGPFGSAPSIMTAVSVIRPNLTTGTKYWLVVTPISEGDSFGWNRNLILPPALNVQRTGTNPWVTHLDYQGTVRLQGGLQFHTLPPCRVLDTRQKPDGPLAGPPLQPGTTRTFNVVASTCGIPAAAKAISMNVTVTRPVGPGYLTLYPGDGAQVPLASTLNFSSGQTRANNAVMPLASDGTGTIKVLAGTGGTVDFILDVNGYFQ